jgi:hypothetical protein
MTNHKLDKYVNKYANDFCDLEQCLLNTIRIPSNGKLKQIINKLPRSNYRNLSTDSSDRLTYKDGNRSISLTRNNQSMGSNKSINSSSLANHPSSLKSHNPSKSIKAHGFEIRKKSKEPSLHKYDNDFSYRDYGDATNDYSGTESHKLLIKKSFDRRNKKNESSMLRLKKMKADRVSLERYMERNNGPIDKRLSKLNKCKYSSFNYIVKLGSYNSRLDSLQKAVKKNPDKVVLAESKLMIRPNKNSSVGSYMSDKITAAYTNRSNQNISGKKIKPFGSINLLKNYYKSKRNQKYSHLKGAASIKLYGRYESRMEMNDPKPINSSVQELRPSNSFIG